LLASCESGRVEGIALSPVPWSAEGELKPDGSDSRTTVDVRANIEEFLGGTAGRVADPNSAAASFDYCYNYFQDFKDRRKLEELADGDHVQQSCLQLGFYLASWGMLRASTQLFRRSIHHYVPLIEALPQFDPRVWDVDLETYSPDVAELLLTTSSEIRRLLTGNVSDILTTKIMLGVFGNVPAFDTYFSAAFGRWRTVREGRRRGGGFSRKSLLSVRDFYEEYSQVLSSTRVYTLDFESGEPTSRQYPAAKLVDMVLFTQGLRMSIAQ